MDWDLYLDSWDRQEQNAYHEFMVVMQADEDKGFTLDRLQLSGTVTDPRWYWWDDHSEMSIALNNIQLERPDIRSSSSLPVFQPGMVVAASGLERRPGLHHWRLLEQLASRSPGSTVWLTPPDENDDGLLQAG